MNVIIFGPPGAGKGTQGEMIAKNFNLFKVSTGDLLRKEIEINSSISKKIKVIEKGNLVPDEIINGLIENILLNKDYYNRLIFDGYPRTLKQAQNLDLLTKKHNQKISVILSLKVDEGDIIKRIQGRRTCSKCGLIFNEYFNPATDENHKCDKSFLQKRVDDTEITLKNRFETYAKKTLPILDYYKNQKLLREIDGNGKINEIYQQIHQIIQSLEA